MKAVRILLLLAMTVSTVSCAYGGIAKVGKGKVVITRNDHLLFGLLRKAMICDVKPSGLSNCKENEQP